MKWLLIVFIGTNLSGTIELESEEACTRAVEVINQTLMVSGDGVKGKHQRPRVRLACLPQGKST